MVQYLPTARDITLPGKMFVEELEKVIHLARLRQRLAIKPHGLGVRNPVAKTKTKTKTEEPHERKCPSHMSYAQKLVTL